MKFRQVVKSVLASFLGVQSGQNRQQDFEQKSALPYVLVGLLAVLLFILCLIAVTQLIIRVAT